MSSFYQVSSSLHKSFFEPALDEKTIQRGREELADFLAERPAERIRLPGAGRPRAEKNVELEPTLERLVEPETAGDPMSEQKWVRSSLRHLSKRLADLGHQVSPPTVGKLLRQLGVSVSKPEKCTLSLQSGGAAWKSVR